MFFPIFLYTQLKSKICANLKILVYFFEDKLEKAVKWDISFLFLPSIYQIYL